MLITLSAGYVVSAIFVCIEYQRLGIKYRQHSILRTSFWIKLTFIFVEVALAVGTCYKENVQVQLLTEISFWCREQRGAL